MLIFKIFEIRGLMKDAKEASKDPVKFGSKLVLKKTKLALILAVIVMLVLLAFFYILGYTELILSSWGLFKVIFWFLLIPSLFTIPLLFTLIKSTSRALNSFPKEVKIEEVKVIEVEEKKEEIK
jgi:hypothetical protein